MIANLKMTSSPQVAMSLEVNWPRFLYTILRFRLMLLLMLWLRFV
jgi:hypothetical protein